MTSSFADIKASARLPQKTVPICVRGDLQAEYEDLERQLKQAEAAAYRTLAGATEEAATIKELMAGLREQMRENTHVFTLQALPKKKWSDLIAQHKPRDEDRANRQDYNAETFPLAAVQACCVSPVMSLAEVTELCDQILTQGQWDSLFLAVFLLNRADVEVPT